MNALRPSQSASRPHGLWSLWELMQRFDASKFVEISNWLAQLHQRMIPGRWVGFPPHEHESLIVHISEIKHQLNEMNLDAAEISADRLLESLGKGHVIEHPQGPAVTFSVQESSLIHAYCGEIVTRARDQLRSRVFLAISSEERELYEQPTPLFGITVAEKFPSVGYEIEECGKCLAFGRATASAFHSIRCLEAGIRAISRSLGISDPTKASQRSWASVRRSVEAELKRRWPTDNDRMSGDGRFFDEAYAALAAMQNPYRNSTMHLDQKYTEAEAKHILEIVKGFMMKLASRCDENGDPKA